MTTEKKVLEIGWIGCRESSICHEGDFEDDAIMDRIMEVTRVGNGSTTNYVSYINLTNEIVSWLRTYI